MPDAVARAVELAPQNSAYLSLRALQIEYGGGDSRPVLERWASLNPLASAPRIRLGLDAEVRGDFDAAQKWLLDAARVDRQFEPAWTLANFYFRQQKMADFWKWMRAALEVSYGDRGPAFDLCRRASAEPREILARALPDQREVWAAYLGYLLNAHEAGAAAPVAMRLAQWHDPGDVPLLYQSCDALLDAGDTSAALQVWTALGQSAPQGIVSPDFDPPRIGQGFDWRLIASPGITHVSMDAPPRLRILFSGQQPESCELLRQYLTLRTGQPYTLRWEARTSGFRARTGLQWKIADQGAAIASSDDWTKGQLEFTVAGVLSLTYQRPSGEVRAEGFIELRHVTVTAR